MFAITGITGQVGGAVARRLLAEQEEVRAVARDAGRASAWTERGCDLVLADMTDPAALTRAFADMAGVFVMLPPIFDPAPGFPEARAVVAALKTALAATRPGKIVCLSTVGAQAGAQAGSDAGHANLLDQLGLLERELATLELPIAFLRAAWFMENAAWDVASARDTGLLHSFLQPTGRAIPMVATADIGALAASLLREDWTGARVIELQGPSPVSPDQLASAFGSLLGRDVRAVAVPVARWDGLFREQGMRDPLPRIRMLEGFNQGWIRFDGGSDRERRTGTTHLDTVLKALLDDR